MNFKHLKHDKTPTLYDIIVVDTSDYELTLILRSKDPW